jgi:hypothetical protein
MKRKILSVATISVIVLALTAVQNSFSGTPKNLGVNKQINYNTGNTNTTAINSETVIFELNIVNVANAVQRLLETITWAPARKGGESEEMAQSISEHETERKWSML